MNKKNILSSILLIMIGILVIPFFVYAQDSFLQVPTLKSTPLINSISPKIGAVGTRVRITGSGFTRIGNTINFGSMSISEITSNGFSLSFIVPPQNVLLPNAISPLHVSVSVTNGNGTSNIVSFGVIPKPTPLINSISPKIGPVGKRVRILGSGFTLSGNTVNFGDTPISNLSSSGSSLSFIVPPSEFLIQNGMSPLHVNVSVTNGNGTSNIVSFGVIPKPTPLINSISPKIGAVGIKVRIVGSGFTHWGNTVQIGNASIPNLTSNGFSLSFRVPAHAIPDPITTDFTFPVNVLVSNANGTSNSMIFSVIPSRPYVPIPFRP